MSNPTQFQKPASMIGKAGGPRVAAAAPQVPAKPLKWYRVLEDKTVTMNKGGWNQQILLRTGKEISSENHDITLLKNRGVKLEEMKETPGWYLEQQRAGLERHAQLTEAGIVLADPVLPPTEPPAA